MPNVTPSFISTSARFILCLQDAEDDEYKVEDDALGIAAARVEEDEVVDPEVEEDNGENDEEIVANGQDDDEGDGGLEEDEDDPVVLAGPSGIHAAGINGSAGAKHENDLSEDAENKKGGKERPDDATVETAMKQGDCDGEER